MERYYENDFTKLRDRLFQMAYLALENYDRATGGLFARDAAQLREAVERDRLLDELEVKIDGECCDLLLRLQPFAKDLRFALMSLKINTNLERMGDQAVSIARAGLDLLSFPAPADFFDLPRLAARAREAVEGALQAFRSEDAELARKVRHADEEINQLYRKILRELIEFSMASPNQIPQSIELVFIAQSLERVADYGKNIADEIIFMVEAEDIRHRS